MLSKQFLHALFACIFLLTFISQVLAQESTAAATTEEAPQTTAAPSSAAVTSAVPLTSGASTAALPSSDNPPTTTRSSNFDPSAPPDVLLDVPELSVGRIELNVDNLVADINLNAEVANLVKINAGVAVSVQKVNITIADVSAELELRVRLGHLVDIVQRVFESLDLNPLLISAIEGVTDLVGGIVGVVDGLLGSITQDGTTLNFIIDNLGNIVQSVVGAGGQTVNTIVGDYLTNMTETGIVKQLGNGLVQKQFSYPPLNSLVDIVFNSLGQVVQATVAKPSGGGPSSGGPTATRTATGSPSPSTAASTTPASPIRR
ncbi:hypothetical protein M501DRAFT_997150 [Patellaria atrata CBS 101060]|uniref:Uncharacterized protein n=1 Tax=Patellaria atrata CBS 101060 TaxID=1346257 RepID=A0A9P4VM86_9PEZI|nr:hypothetical protein M501DRAFT_997150 [Patellaria atrata CBS 101060]